MLELLKSAGLGARSGRCFGGIQMRTHWTMVDDNINQIYVQISVTISKELTASNMRVGYLR